MPKVPSSTDRKYRLADKVAVGCRTMPTPCSRCRTSRPPKECKVSLASGRCLSCISSGAKCDLVVTEKDWEKVERQEEDLRRQLADARRQQDEAFSQLRAAQAAALAKEERLLTQLRFLESRRAEMIRRELSSIEELEKLEEEERQARAAVAAPSVSSGVGVASEEPTPDFLGSPSSWGFCLDGFGETGSPPPGILSGS